LPQSGHAKSTGVEILVWGTISDVVLLQYRLWFDRPRGFPKDRWHPRQVYDSGAGSGLAVLGGIGTSAGIGGVTGDISGGPLLPSGAVVPDGISTCAHLVLSLAIWHFDACVAQPCAESNSRWHSHRKLSRNVIKGCFTVRCLFRDWYRLYCMLHTEQTNIFVLCVCCVRATAWSRFAALCLCVISRRAI